MRVLLTGVGGPAGSSLAGQLTARGVWTAGVDVRQLRDDRLAACAEVPPAGDPAYVRVLAGLVREWNIEAVIPSVSEELPLLARSRHEIPAPVLIGAAGAVAVANDKFTTAQQLSDFGVAVPRSALPSSFGSLAAAVDALGAPVIVKPRVSRGGRGVRVVDPAQITGAQARSLWGELHQGLVVQEFAPGVEYAPVVFRSPADGPRVCVVLEKLALREGLVGNATDVVRLRDDDERAVDVAQLAWRAVESLGLTGPVDLDIRRRSDGVPVVLEVNARFGANSAHAPELVEVALEHLAQLRDEITLAAVGADGS